MIERPRPPVADIDLPSRSDPVVAGLSQVIGGPIGDRARLNRRVWTPMRVVLALACVVLALSWVQKSPCRSGAWVDNVQYKKHCYTDVLALYYAERLNQGAVPYLDHEVEYPVLTGIFMGVIGRPVWKLGNSDWVNGTLLPTLADYGLAEGGPLNQGKLFFDLNALVLGILGVITVWTIVRMRPARPWDGAMVALAPALFVTATVNWDLLAIGLTSLGIYFWSRRAPGWAGFFLGLAVAAKFYPLFIIGPLALLCLRRKKLPDFVITAGTAVVTWVALNLPIYYAAPDAWLKFWRLSDERAVDWGTLWYVGAHFPVGGGKVGIWPFTDLSSAENIPNLNTLSQSLFVLGCVGIAALILFSKRPPRLGQVAFLVVAVFLLTSKVWSQQFVLWLIPLAVLARPKWTAFLAWQACELAYFFGFYQILLRTAGGKSLMPEKWFALIGLARWVAVAVLCALVVREILRPELDVVRSEGIEDPEGGVLNDPPPEPRADQLPSGLVEDEHDRVTRLGTT